MSRTRTLAEEKVALDTQLQFLKDDTNPVDRRLHCLKRICEMRNDANTELQAASKLMELNTPVYDKALHIVKKDKELSKHLTKDDK